MGVYARSKRGSASWTADGTGGTAPRCAPLAARLHQDESAPGLASRGPGRCGAARGAHAPRGPGCLGAGTAGQARGASPHGHDEDRELATDAVIRSPNWTRTPRTEADGQLS